MKLSEEFPCFLLYGGASQPVAYFQVGDEAACHRKRRTNHTAHDQCGYHSARAFQTYCYHYYRCKYQRHKCHARYRVCAHNGNGISSYGGKEE